MTEQQDVQIPADLGRRQKQCFAVGLTLTIWTALIITMALGLFVPIREWAWPLARASWVALRFFVWGASVIMISATLGTAWHLGARSFQGGRRVMAGIGVLTLIWTILGWGLWIYMNAPITEPADPNISPNPSKAPWWFLCFQEIIIYLDPWLAGVFIPGLLMGTPLLLGGAVLVYWARRRAG